jgi:hypothetical protein
VLQVQIGAPAESEQVAFASQRVLAHMETHWFALQVKPAVHGVVALHSGPGLGGTAESTP